MKPCILCKRHRTNALQGYNTAWHGTPLQMCHLRQYCALERWGNPERPFELNWIESLGLFTGFFSFSKASLLDFWENSNNSSSGSTSLLRNKKQKFTSELAESRKCLTDQFSQIFIGPPPMPWEIGAQDKCKTTSGITVTGRQPRFACRAAPDHVVPTPK